MISEDKKTVTSKSGETFMVTDRYAENHGSAPSSEHTLELSQFGSNHKKEGMYVFYADINEGKKLSVRDSEPTVGTYKNGKKDGPAYHFSAKGDLEWVEIYENGGLKKSYDESNPEFSELKKTSEKTWGEYQKMLNSLRTAEIEYELPKTVNNTKSDNVFGKVLAKLSGAQR